MVENVRADKIEYGQLRGEVPYTMIFFHGGEEVLKATACVQHLLTLHPFLRALCYNKGPYE